MDEIRLLETSSYRNFVRMDVATFEDLLRVIAPRITYQDTVMRQAISPGERLAVTLRFLATGIDNLHCIYTHVYTLLQVKPLKVYNIFTVFPHKQLVKSCRKHAVR